MRINEIYNNFPAEWNDTFSNKNVNKETQDKKVASIALKVIGAILMVSGVIAFSSAISSGLGTYAVIKGLFLTILGYDCAEIGHTLREQVDGYGFVEGAKAVGNMVLNSIDMGPEKGIKYTFHGYNARNTILVSRIIKLAVYLTPNRD